MLLPIIGCFATGSVFLFSDSSVIRGSSEEAQSQWVGFLYFVAVSLSKVCAARLVLTVLTITSR